MSFLLNQAEGANAAEEEVESEKSMSEVNDDEEGEDDGSEEVCLNLSVLIPCDWIWFVILIVYFLFLFLGRGWWVEDGMKYRIIIQAVKMFGHPMPMVQRSYV